MNTQEAFQALKDAITEEASQGFKDQVYRLQEQVKLLTQENARLQSKTIVGRIRKLLS